LLVGHDVYSVAYMKWNGIENGQLLKLAAANGFDALITKDNGIPYEQNAASLSCAIVVIQARSNALIDIQPLVPRILLELRSLVPKSVLRIG